jgi:thioredoxin 2
MTSHVVCPNCHVTNRVPKDKLDGGVELSCGKCHQTLFQQHPAALDAVGLQAQIAKSDVPVVVDFWAPWCGPCQMMAPEYEKACAVLEPKARLVKVDTEAHPQLAMQYNIRSIPTLAIFRGGREVARLSGARSAPDLVKWVHASLK